MIKPFFKDIFEYHNHYNQKLADLLIANKEQISERSIPLFSHMINAHQIWNSRILNTSSLGVNDVHTLEKCKALGQSNFTDSLKILDNYDLTTVIKYRSSEGETYQNTIQEILYHASNHHTHHRAQIVSDLRQKGIEPIATDYIFYKR